MLIVLLDEPGLWVYDSIDPALADIEPPDAETTIRAVFDGRAVPYSIEWLQDNRHGRLLGLLPTVNPGRYRIREVASPAA